MKTAWANPWVRRPVLLALALAVVFGGSWVVIDRLGKQAWREMAAQLAAEGETTDFRSLLPAPVPEAENFCAIGPLRNLAADEKDQSPAGAEGRANRARIKTLMKERPAKKAGMHGLHSGTPLDFPKMAEEMREEGSWPMPKAPGDAVQDVQAGLAKWDPLLEELTAGLGRPRAQWMPTVSQRPMPRPYIATTTWHMASALNLSQSLTLRAAVAGRAGDMPRAVELLRMNERIAVATSDEPLLFSGLVSNVIAGLSGHALWELAAAQLGTSEDWVQLEQLMTAVDLRAVWLRSYRSELAAGVDWVSFAKQTRQTTSLTALLMHGFPFEPSDPIDATVVAVLRVAPEGFYDSLATEIAGDELMYMVRPLRVEGWPGFLRQHQLLQARLNDPAPFLNLPARMMRPLVQTGNTIVGVYNQVLMDQAATACVLERTRLSSGSYPASLDGLTLADGRPLPLDACTGAPMHYRQTPDGRYMLWSAGADGNDDGGTRGSGPVTEDAYKGDWVWGYSASP